MNPFESEEIAQSYDDFYQNPVGQMYDRLEKAAIKSLLIEKFPQIANFSYTGTLLEIGAGTGHWSEFFASLGFRVTGIEPSQPMINCAIRKKIKNADFYRQNGESFTLPKEHPKFDILAFITSLEFMENPQKVIQNAIKYINPKGSIIFGVLNDNSTLGQNRKTDPNIYSNAHFFIESELFSLFNPYGQVSLRQCAFPEPNQIVESDKIEVQNIQNNNKTGKFIAGRVDLFKSQKNEILF